MPQHCPKNPYIRAFVAYTIYVKKKKEYIHVFNKLSTIAGRFNLDGMGNENCLSPKWVFSFSIVTLSTKKNATFAKLKVKKSKKN
jgi:hypothetical protein